MYSGSAKLRFILHPSKSRFQHLLTVVSVKRETLGLKYTGKHVTVQRWAPIGNRKLEDPGSLGNPVPAELPPPKSGLDILAHAMPSLKSLLKTLIRLTVGQTLW